MGLTPEELRARRAFDDEAIRSMLPSPILEVRGFVSLDAMKAGCVATLADGAAGRILFYTVRYGFPVLIGPGPTTDDATTVFNASVYDYPFTTPIAHVTSQPRPWSPHVHPTTGIVCQGFAWQRARGRMLLAHAIVHIARLLNCDEEDREATYIGYNAAAIRYWRETMRRRPITPGLRYPTPRSEVTHGIAATRLAESHPAFRLLDHDELTKRCDGFRLMEDEDSSGIRLIEGI